MTQKHRGIWKPNLPGSLPRGVDSGWEQTGDRLVWELLEEYYFRSARRSTNPETAFAASTNLIKGGLYRSVSSFFYRDCDHRLMRFVNAATGLPAQATEAKADRRESRIYKQCLIPHSQEALQIRKRRQR